MPKARRIAMVVAPALVLLIVAVIVLILSSGRDATETAAGPATSDGLPAELREAVTLEGIMDHARRFQRIADEHSGNRAAGTPGYDASAAYVANELREAGYEVKVQRFEFPASAATLDAELREMGVPDAREYALGTDFAPMEGTPGGEVRASLRPVDEGSPTSGCEAGDFAGFVRGDVALLRRGVCTFGTKARNAEAAGASAAIVFNDGEPQGEVLFGELDGPPTGIPVLGTSATVGEDLLARDGASGVRVFVGDTGANSTTNVIAQTRGGNEDETVMVGAHLDSVPQGPGINDNGSGSATVLEIALQLAEIDPQPKNRVRFAFWGAEEIGLLGSRHYVENLSDNEIEDISAYLNFDMLGSPNFVRSVYEGPDEVEGVFSEYFDEKGIQTETNSALDGRSDHGPFQDEGVPTGGLFSGAGGTKTRNQQEAFGGEVGAPFDACYHQECDDIENLNEKSLDQLSDGAAHATAVLAQS
ncbi:M20/M25/M40 family metallo-hydrolase [Rubrobacter tropicus]|nr:M20/M25/M40 family metallo-hydrolase [Rubrobacter tropicus]